MILKAWADLYLKAISETKKPINELEMIDVGNTIIKRCLGIRRKISARDYWLKQNIKRYHSIDINGKNGAEKLDLRQEHPQYDNQFDIVVNPGTLEHLEPPKPYFYGVSSIYTGFENVHKWCRDGGIMFHVGPPMYTAPWHSPWHYDLGFFANLAKYNDYEEIQTCVVVDMGRTDRRPEDQMVIVSILRKTNDREFTNVNCFEDCGLWLEDKMI
ncbi:MAG: hypothetical protein ABIH89_11000 [Elusimicrobiota bacterium]